MRKRKLSHHTPTSCSNKMNEWMNDHHIRKKWCLKVYNFYSLASWHLFLSEFAKILIKYISTRIPGSYFIRYLYSHVGHWFLPSTKDQMGPSPPTLWWPKQAHCKLTTEHQCLITTEHRILHMERWVQLILSFFTKN